MERWRCWIQVMLSRYVCCIAFGSMLFYYIWTYSTLSDSLLPDTSNRKQKQMQSKFDPFSWTTAICSMQSLPLSKIWSSIMQRQPRDFRVLWWCKPLSICLVISGRNERCIKWRWVRILGKPHTLGRCFRFWGEHRTASRCYGIRSNCGISENEN